MSKRKVEETLTDHYAILGLPSGKEGAKLSQKEITKAYHKQALLRHPDKRQNDPAATADFQLLQASYTILMNPEDRHKFDLKLGQENEIIKRAKTEVSEEKMRTEFERRSRSLLVFWDHLEFHHNSITMLEFFSHFGSIINVNTQKIGSFVIVLCSREAQVSFNLFIYLFFVIF